MKPRDDNANIKPIETSLYGYRFRSRLEARMAVFLRTAGIPFRYEAEGFDLGDGVLYLPDFDLYDHNCFLEVKPGAKDLRRQSIYLAGKMTRWRAGLHLRGHLSDGPEVADDTNGHGDPDVFGLHGQDEREPCATTIVEECKKSVRDADCVFAWIDSADSFGTFAEIGYANAFGIPVRIGFSMALLKQYANKSTPFADRHGVVESRHDLWFIQELSQRSVFTQSPQEAFDLLFPLDGEQDKCTRLAKAAEAPVWMVCGDPQEDRFYLFHESGEWYPHGLAGFAKRVQIDMDTARRAASAARAARFEHGEKPR